MSPNRALPSRCHLRLFASAILLVFLFASVSGFGNVTIAQWTQLTGPEPPVVSALATDGTTILLGTNESDAGELFRSTDDGLTWTNAVFPNGGVGALLYDNGNFYLGNYLDGLYRSSDGGFEWDQVTVGLTVEAVARHGSSLFTGEGFFGPSPIYRSDDDGLTWSPIPSGPNIVLLSLFSDGSSLFAGSRAAGMYRSTDGGASWQSVPDIPGLATVSSICELDGDLYAGLHQSTPAVVGVFRSTDGGDTWTQTSGSPITGADDIRRLVAHEGSLYAGVNSIWTGGVFRSSDQGATWVDFGTSLPGEHKVGDFLFDLDEPGAFLVGVADGIYRTTDDAVSWTDVRQGTGAIRGARCVLEHAGALHVSLTTNGSVGRGVWKSTDLGSSWSISPGFHPQTSVREFYSYGSEILAGLYTPFPRGIFRSSDNGESWESSSAGISTSTIINDIHEHQGTLWVAAWEALYRSTDDGVSWTTPSGFDIVESVESFGDHLVIGTREFGVRATSDGGETWLEWNDGLPSDPSIDVLEEFQGTLFASVRFFGIYRLDGATWVKTSLDTRFHNVLLGVGSALVTESVLNDTIYYTLDLGDTWVPWDEGYAGGEVYSITTWEDQLVVGTRGRGIWARPVAEMLEPAGAPEPTPSAVLSLSLDVWPNPVREHSELVYHLAEDAKGSAHAPRCDGTERCRTRRGLAWSREASRDAGLVTARQF